MSRCALLVVPAAALLAAAAFHLAAHADAPPTDRDAARIELGRRLFFDPAIGRQGRIGCASCHDPEHGFSDARTLSLDETGYLPRHSQPLTDLAGDGFHWDGEFDTVREVVEARVLPGVLPTAASVARTRRRLEAAASTRVVDAEAVTAAAKSVGSFSVYYGAVDRAAAVTTIDARVQADARYDAGFRAAFGDTKVTSARISEALAAYLATLRTSTSPFDRFLAGDQAALSPAARRGLEAFRGKAGCSLCHVADGPHAPLTDGKFHNTGIAARHTKQAFSEFADAGRAAMSFDGRERGAFKTPSLRDVALRPPYFHDGSAKTLEDVVRYYAAGGTANDHLDVRLHALQMSDAEVADLVEFLRSLTGSERAGLGAASPGRAPRLTVRAERPDGSAAADVRVVVRPCGDRLEGTTSMPAPVAAITRANGEAVVDMPLSTHFTVEAPGTPGGRPLPDWTSSTRVIVTPTDRIGLIVQFPRSLLQLPSAVTVSTNEPGSRDRLWLDFSAERTLSPGTVLFTAPASATRRGVRLCDLAAEWLSTRAPMLSIDFTPGATSHVELWAPPEQRRSNEDATDAVNTLGPNAEAIRRLADDIVKRR